MGWKKVEAKMISKDDITVALQKPLSKKELSQIELQSVFQGEGNLGCLNLEWSAGEKAKS